MGITDRIRTNRQRILEIAMKYCARNVRIFGSLARGEGRTDSDVDLLVDMELGRTLFDLGGLIVDLEELLGCKVDVVTEKGLNKYIKDQVLKEAVSL